MCGMSDWQDRINTEMQAKTSGSQLKERRYCDLEIWPLYAGDDQITIGFIDGHGDDAKDLLIVKLSHEEATALADLIQSAVRCKSDGVTYALRSLEVSEV